jgi:hypothetical protein
MTRSGFRSRLTHRLTAVGRLADDLPTGLRVDDLPQALANQRVIVGEEDPYRCHIRRSSQAGARW